MSNPNYNQEVPIPPPPKPLAAGEEQPRLTFSLLNGPFWTRDIQSLRWSATRFIGMRADYLFDPNHVLASTMSLHLSDGVIYRVYGAFDHAQKLVAITTVKVDEPNARWILPQVNAAQDTDTNPLFPLLDYVVQQMESEGVCTSILGCIPAKYRRAYDRRRHRESVTYAKYDSETLEVLAPYTRSADHIVWTELMLSGVCPLEMHVRRYWKP